MNNAVNKGNHFIFSISTAFPWNLAKHVWSLSFWNSCVL